ncbi:hypothetical protein THOM_0973 [Trachipleistophora hominis]|uniref:Uncharacterized protein n=1 Tax=Trachipleistophora hominis TaxID=72359 RepID=L7JX65_TRAHO|nr:hypothetical protein THOM_0973 [Trachipleistophora hominis]
MKNDDRVPCHKDEYRKVIILALNFPYFVMGIKIASLSHFCT